jgi:hypothetical protein
VATRGAAGRQGGESVARFGGDVGIFASSLVGLRRRHRLCAALLRPFQRHHFYQFQMMNVHVYRIFKSDSDENNTFIPILFVKLKFQKYLLKT